MQNADCIVMQGSNMAECHPVGFQWIMEAKARGATVIHVDPRLTRTGALADLHVPIRVGTDIALIGGLINYVLSNGLEFRDYVVAYTNAATIVAEDFQDTEDLDGLFSGWQDDKGSYATDSWQYEGVSVAGSAGKREQGAKEGRDAEQSGKARSRERHVTGRGHEHGSHGAALEDLHQIRRDTPRRRPRPRPRRPGPRAGGPAPDPPGRSPAAPALRLPGPQGALPPVHPRDGGPHLRHRRGAVPPAGPRGDRELHPGPDHG